MSRTALTWAAIAAVASLSAGSSARAVDYQTVVVVGQQAPGEAPGVTITGLGGAPVNAAGQVAFEGYLGGSGIDPEVGESALYRWTNGTLDRIARHGDPAPQLGAGASIVSPTVNSILPDGTVSFFASRSSGGVANYSDVSLWTSPTATAGAGQPLVRIGQPAPGVADRTIGSILWTEFPGDRFTFATELKDGDETKAYALYGGPRSSTPQLLVRSKEQAPDMPVGVTLTDFSTHAYDADGHTIFAGGYQDFGVGYGDGNALWHRDAAGQTSLLARTGTAAPGAGGDLYDGQITGRRLADGTVIHKASLRDPNHSDPTGVGFWMGPAGSPQLVFRDGDAAPQVAGAELRNLIGFDRIGDADDYTLTATFGGSGVTTGVNDAAVWRGALDDMQLVWRAGEAAPELSGLTFGGLSSATHDDAGHFLIHAYLAGDGVDPNNDEAFYLYSPDGLATLLAREGGTLNVNGGIWNVGNIAGALAPGTSGRVMLFTGDGILLAQVPEPATLGAAGLLLSAAVLRRHRKA